MTRTIAELPKGSRLTDFISLGVIAKTFPAEQVQEVLRQTAKQSQRERELPAHVVVYYVIALALYMRVSYREVLRCLLEGLAWLAGPGARLTNQCITWTMVFTAWPPLERGAPPRG